MVAKRCRITPAKACIWTGPGDTLPFETPLLYLSRVKFHTDLDYMPIVDVKDYTLNLPAISSAGSGQGAAGTGRRGLRTELYTLGPHGRAGTPFCLGEIEVAGHPIAFVGTVPVDQIADDPYARTLALGYDDSNITIYEYSVQRGVASPVNWRPRPALTVAIRVYISGVYL